MRRLSYIGATPLAAHRRLLVSGMRVEQLPAEAKVPKGGGAPSGSAACPAGGGDRGCSGCSDARQWATASSSNTRRNLSVPSSPCALTQKIF